MNPLLIGLVVAVVVMLIVRVAAPRVAARWPGSWADVLLAFLLRFSSDWLGALIGLAKGQGASGSLVPSPDLESVAQRAYEAYATALDWVAHSGNQIPPWSELPAERRQGWYVVASVLQAGTKARPSSPPPAAGVLPLGVLALAVLHSSGCTPQQARDAQTAASVAIDHAPELIGGACEIAQLLGGGKTARVICKVLQSGGDGVIHDMGTGPSVEARPASYATVEFVMTREEAEAFVAKNGGAK